MSDRVSPWVRNTITVYLVLIGVGWVMGMMSGGLGAFWIMPLLLPWIAIPILIEPLIHRMLYDNLIASFISIPLAGALNAWLLFLFLRLVDRRQRAESGSDVAAGSGRRLPLTYILPAAYALLVVIATVLSSMEDHTEPSIGSTALSLPLMFPWIIALFFLPRLPDVVGNIIFPLAAGLLNAFLLYLLLRYLRRRREGRAVLAE